jgi:hypothetical protein
MPNPSNINGSPEHLSHLCGDPRCFRISHLVVESSAANNSRKNCLVAAVCPCPCDHVFWLCKHRPRCIPPPEFAKRLPQSFELVWRSFL